jgi:excisionase family DNA binding protein
LANPAQNERRMSLDQRDLNNRIGPPASRRQAMPTQVRGRAAAPSGNCGEQPPTELIAHLVVALSRYVRHLRSEGGRVPTQIEDLIAFLTDGVRARHDLAMLDSWRAPYGPSAMPERLLITKSDAADLLGVSLRTIERLISAGRLPLVHVEGAARVRVSDLEAYVQGLKAEGGATGSHPPPESRQ